MIKAIARNMLGMISGPFLLLCLAVGFAWASDDDLYSFIRLFDRIAITVADRYVSPLDPKKMIYAGIDGMLEELDPYSCYLSDKKYYHLMRETQGEYIGIGIGIRSYADTIRINSIIEGSPAFNSNLKKGDRILKIDNINVVGSSESEFRNLLRGDKGSLATLSLWRPFKNEKMTLEFVREKIHIKSVPCWCIDNFNNGYIKIARFSEGSAREVSTIISLLQDKGIRGLIIDMQNNPGGLLNEAVEIASLFLNEGDKVVETRGRNAKTLRTYRTREDGIYIDGPLVVVIDDQTASAAEIVAGAIQDYDRGLIIGSTSFGKGLVQQVLQFDENSALKLTTARYYTPSERCIQKDTSKSDLIKDKDFSHDILFYTNSGRPVFGGGGIIPDIYVDRLDNPPFLDEIITLGYVPDFVSEYAPGLNIDEDFIVSEKLVDLFFEYLEKRGYVYYNPDFNSFNHFISENEEWVNQTSFDGHMAAIKNILSDRSFNEMKSYRSQLKDFLYESLIKTGLGEKKAYELVWLKTRPELVKASEVLNNPKSYSNLLVGFK